MRKQLIKRMLVIVGVSMMAFPFLRLKYGESQTQKRIEEVEERTENKKIQKSAENMRESGEENNEEENRENVTEKADKQGMGIGIIKIEKIGLQYPVVEGAGQEELCFAVGHVDGTAGIGEKGNCVLAGHRGSRYGAFFRRIGELREGDEIRLMDGEGVWYRYMVSEKFVVRADEVWVLEQDGEEKVTLISCENGGRERVVVVGRKNGIDNE